MKSIYIRATLLVLFTFVIVNNIIFIPGNILAWDVFGYYLYLPLYFIYNDLGIKDESIIQGILEQYANSTTFYQAGKINETHYVMKYPMGMAFFYAPFFAIGHIIASLSDYAADGFSKPYQYAIFSGGIFYSLAGLFFLTKVLLRFFSKRITIIVLFIIVFATNYVVHFTMYGQNAMSHNYLFTAYALILWLTIKWHETYKIKYILLLGLICGLATLSRPSEFVCILIPALWGITSKQSALEKYNLILNKHRKQLIYFSLIIISIGFFQFSYWKIYTGSFFYNSYGNPGEGLDLFSPHTIQLLFSFRKGWLIYTPVMMFAIAGFYFLYKKNNYIFYALFGYFLINLYLVSAWSNWWYTESFSQRSLPPSYPVMAIALGYFLTWLHTNKRLVWLPFYLLIGAFLILNIFQTHQFNLGVIPGDGMTKAYYFKVFGKTYATEKDRKLLLVKRAPDQLEVLENPDEYQCKPFKTLDFENDENADTAYFFSGRKSFRVDSEVPFSPLIAAPYYDITEKDHAWIKISAQVFPTGDTDANPFSLVFHFTYKGKTYNYRGHTLSSSNTIQGEWNTITRYFLTPEVRSKRDEMRVYFWHHGESPVFIDDMTIEVCERIY